MNHLPIDMGEESDNKRAAWYEAQLKKRIADAKAQKEPLQRVDAREGITYAAFGSIKGLARAQIEEFISFCTYKRTVHKDPTFAFDIMVVERRKYSLARMEAMYTVYLASGV